MDDSLCLIELQCQEMAASFPLSVSPQPFIPPNNQEEQEHFSLRERIVEIMSNYPCLWCTTLRSYKDLTKKNAAWRELSYKLNTSGKISVWFFKTRPPFVFQKEPAKFVRQDIYFHSSGSHFIK